MGYNRRMIRDSHSDAAGPARGDLPGAIALLPRPHRRAALVAAGVVLGWAAFNYVWSLGNHPLWFPGEAAHAVAAQRGDATGPGGMLRQWGLSRVGGELGLRLPGAVFSLLVAAATAWAATRWRDGLTGLIAAVLLLTDPLNALIARVAVDAAFIVPIVLAPLAVVVAAWVRPWLDDDADRRGAPVVFVAAAVIVTVLIGGAAVVFAVPALSARLNFDPALAGPMLRLLLQAMLCAALAWVAVVMYRAARRRVWAMILMGLALTCTVTAGISVEDALTRRNSVPALFERIEKRLGGPPKQVWLYSPEASSNIASVKYYSDAPVYYIRSEADRPAPRYPLATLVTASGGFHESVPERSRLRWRRPFGGWMVLLQREAHESINPGPR